MKLYVILSKPSGKAVAEICDQASEIQLCPAGAMVSDFASLQLSFIC